MYQSIGVNLSKSIDNLTKKIKVPAITQRDYYTNLNCDDNDSDCINFYSNDYEDDSIGDEEEPTYLEDDEYEDECPCNNCCDLDTKTIALIGAGTVIGVVGLYFLLRRK